jgi:hypothetical protein
MSGRGRHRDRRQSAKREVPQDDLVGERDASERGVEGGGDRAGNATGDGDGLRVAQAQSQPCGERADERAEMDERTVLADRSAGETSAAKVEPSPLPTPGGGLRVCTVRMASAGPNGRWPATVRCSRTPTTRPPRAGTRTVAAATSQGRLSNWIRA